eukprot:15340825-Ditylum_brightwellii.AAC.1
MNLDGQHLTSKIVKGHVVIKDLISNYIKLLPATINPYIEEGPAISWFRYGNSRAGIFNTILHNFGNAQGTQAGIEMCHLAMCDSDMVAIIPKADHFWKMAKQDTMALFSTTYVDTIPATWSSQFLAAKYIWAFLQHILWC